MTIIYAATEDQHLIATILPKLSQNNVNTVRLHVVFDDSWSAYPAKSAVFTTSKSVRPYPVPMSAGGDCLIPPEVLAEECKLYIVVEGVNSATGATKASTRLTVKVLGGHPAVVISDPAPSVYRQLLEQLVVANSRISNLVVGSTDDTELIDARAGASGEIYKSTGDNIRRQAETLENLSRAIYGHYDVPTVWTGENLNGNSASNRIRTQERVAKGEVDIYIPDGYRAAVGTYDSSGALDTDSGWKEGHYFSNIEIGTRYRVVVAKTNDSNIDVSAGAAVVIRERYEVENLEARLEAVERIEDRFRATRNVFTGKWINANIANGDLVLYEDNAECAAVAEYMPISVSQHVVSWGALHNVLNLYIYFYRTDRSYISREQFYNLTGEGYRAFVVPDGAAYYRVAVYSTASAVWQNNIPSDFQVEKGDTPTQYVAAKTIRTSRIDTDELYKKLPTYRNIASATVNSIAHRGNPIDAPQCTEPAYVEAKMRGFNIAENDLHMSSDGKLVMWHDETLGRLGTYLKNISGDPMYDANARQMVGSNYSVRDLPLATLKQIDFGAYMGDKFAGTQILTFAEWVKLCKTLGLQIYIDKKIKLTADIVSEMVAVVKKYGMVQHTSWVCWDFNEVNLIRSEIRNARIIFLDAPTESNVTSRRPLLNNGAVVFNPHTLTLNEENVMLALSAGFDVECWNVDYSSYGLNNEAEIFAEIVRVCELGVGGVTLDKYRVEDAIISKWCK